MENTLTLFFELTKRQKMIQKLTVGGYLAGLIILLFNQGCSLDKLYQMGQRNKIYGHEQLNFKDLTKLYFGKTQSSLGTIEGIYSVSVVIIKKSRGLLSSTERERTVERKENLSKVAILRDPGNANREYMEVSMDREYTPSYSIVGEFTRATDSNILIYKHFEPKGKTSSYTFTYDKTSDLLEGIRTESSGSTTFTYKLTYIKLLPKVAEKEKI
jgi:hypothetical protein